MKNNGTKRLFDSIYKEVYSKPMREQWSITLLNTFYVGYSDNLP